MNKIFALSTTLCVLLFAGSVFADVESTPYLFDTSDSHQWQVQTIYQFPNDGTSANTEYDPAVHALNPGIFNDAVKVTANNSWSGANWISTNAEGQDHNGFYSYLYMFDRNTNVEQYASMIRALVYSDDHIDAILFNGVAIDYTVNKVQGGTFTGWTIESTFLATNPALILETDNTLEFIVQGVAAIVGNGLSKVESNTKCENRRI